MSFRLKGERATGLKRLLLASVLLGALAVLAIPFLPVESSGNVSTVRHGAEETAVPQSELARAIQFVHSEAHAASGSTDSKNDKFRAYAALSASSYVRTLMSSGRYGLALSTSAAAPPTGTETCLAQRSGICGNHVEGFVDILRSLKVPVREVQIYYTDSAGRRASHIVAEVHWSGAWRMFDVTWGFVPHDGRFMDALSFEQARKRRGLSGWHDEVHPTRVSAVMANTHIFDYLEASTSDVVIAGEGTVRPYIAGATADRLTFGLDHIPNHVGRRITRSGSVGEVIYQVDIPSGFTTLAVVPLHVRCENGFLLANGDRQPISTHPIVFAPVKGKVVLRVDSPGRQCFLDLKGMYASADKGQVR